MGPLQQTNKKSKRHRHRHHHHETSSTTLAFAFEANTTRQILSEHSPLAAAAAAASEASIHQRTMIYLTANRFLRSPSKKKIEKEMAQAAMDLFMASFSRFLVTIEAYFVLFMTS